MTSQGNSYSTPLPSPNSGVNTPLPPPPPAATRPEHTSRRTTAGTFSIPGSRVLNSDPIMVSNNEIISLFSQVKNQLAQQEKSNETIRKEMESLRARINNPVTPATTPLEPRILNFDMPGSSGNASGFSENLQGDFIPMRSGAGIQGPTPAVRITTTRDHGSNPGSMFHTPGIDNVFNNISSGTNNFQDPGISPLMAKELQKLKDMISSVPGVVQPIPEAAPASHRISRFAPPLCDAEIPKRFQTPSMKLYDGTTDPEDHVAQYRERMEIIPISADLKEACLCKGFGSTLTGSALKWLLNVPPYSITSFSHLINLFNSQFSCSRTFEKLTNDLYRVTQKTTESLRDYVSRFGRESLDIPNLDVATAVQAFKMGLKKESRFYQDLVMNPCRTLDEVRNRAIRFIRLEEDTLIQKRIEAPTPYDHPNRKQGSSSYRSHQNKPYSRSDNHRVNAVEDDEDDENYPKLIDYCFSVDVSGLMYAMQNLGDKARWPKKNDKNPGWKDKSKWCAYHEDFGHITEDCIALRKEISHLLSKGYLKELLGKKKDHSRDALRIPEPAIQDPNRALQRAGSPPSDAKIINFISGGSDICGTSYSAAKRHAKEAKSEKEFKPTRSTTLEEEKMVSFSEDDLQNIQDPHHDGLVITLYVANHFVRRILIDGGSSANIIRLETLKRMNISEAEITPKSIVLVGFSGEAKNTVGEIKLPVYIEGVNSIQRFCVIDTLSCYNIILGRPWIHDMKAVPSTYHQCVKLPSPWGIIKINSDQQESKDCYTTSMKTTAKPPQA